MASVYFSSSVLSAGTGQLTYTTLNELLDVVFFSARRVFLCSTVRIQYLIFLVCITLTIYPLCQVSPLGQAIVYGTSA